MHIPPHISSLLCGGITFYRGLRKRAFLPRPSRHNRVLYATDADGGIIYRTDTDGAAVDGPQDGPLRAHAGQPPQPVQAERASSYKRRQMMRAANTR